MLFRYREIMVVIMSNGARFCFQGILALTKFRPYNFRYIE